MLSDAFDDLDAKPVDIAQHGIVLDMFPPSPILFLHIDFPSYHGLDSSDK